MLSVGYQRCLFMTAAPNENIVKNLSNSKLHPNAVLRQEVNY